MKKKLKIVLCAFSCALVFIFCFGVFNVLFNRSSFSANAELSKTDYNIADYAWGNYFNFKGLLIGDYDNYTLSRTSSGKNDNYYISFNKSSPGIFRVANNENVLSDIVNSDYYTMSFRVNIISEGIEEPYDITRLRLVGFDEEGNSQTVADFVVNGFQSYSYSSAYIDVSKLVYNGSYSGLQIAFLDNENQVVNMPVGTELVLQNIMITRGVEHYNYTPYFYSLNVEDLSSSEDSSSEESSSEDSSSSDGDSSGVIVPPGSGDYQDGYNDGYSAGFNAGSNASLGVFGGVQLYYSVAVNEGYGYQDIGTFRYDGELNYIEGGLGFSNFVEFLKVRYGDKDFLLGNVEIIFSSQLPFSMLDLRANGNPLFFEKTLFLYNVNNDYIPASFVPEEGQRYYRLTYDDDKYLPIFDYSVSLKKIVLAHNLGIDGYLLLEDFILFDGNAGYNKGYSAGFEEGKLSVNEYYESVLSEVYQSGYAEGKSDGFGIGKAEGLRIGVESTSLNDSIKTFVYSVFEAPIYVLEGLFSLDFVGFDLSGVIRALVSLLVVAFVINKVI